MRMRYHNALPVAVIVCMIFAFSGIPSSFAFDKPLETIEASPAEITGTFNLVLYGGRFSDDVETIAILDLEGDGYLLEPFAPDFDFRIRKSVSAKEALEQAQKFVGFHNAFWRSQLSRIMDKTGNTIGYEIRPLYLPFYFGVSDVFEVYYWLKENGRVKVTIKLIPFVERRRFPGGDGDGPFGGD
jgi:hypothetical protein